MRTTIRLDDALMQRLKQLAAKTRRTFTAIVEESLRETLASAERRPPRKRTRLKTSRGAFRPGVDLDRSSALLDLMDEADAAS